MSYEFTYRGYRLVFENDESAADIFLDGEKIHTATNTTSLEWAGDEARQVEVTTLVNAIRWIGKDIAARRAADASPLPLPASPPANEQTTPNDPTADKVSE